MYKKGRLEHLTSSIIIISSILISIPSLQPSSILTCSNNQPSFELQFPRCVSHPPSPSRPLLSWELPPLLAVLSLTAREARVAIPLLPRRVVLPVEVPTHLQPVAATPPPVAALQQPQPQLLDLSTARLLNRSAATLKGVLKDQSPAQPTPHPPHLPVFSVESSAAFSAVVFSTMLLAFSTSGAS